jgi:hypothetical protein
MQTGPAVFMRFAGNSGAKLGANFSVRVSRSGCARRPFSSFLQKALAFPRAIWYYI